MVEVASSDSVVRILVVEGLTEVVLAGVVGGVVGLGRVGRSVENVTDPSTVVQRKKKREPKVRLGDRDR